MRTKSAHFYRCVSLHEYDIIVITETWLHENICSSEYFDSYYHVYRNDRCPNATGFGKGGGVLLAIRADWCSKEIKLDYGDGKLEQICISVTFPNNKSIIFLLSYIPDQKDLTIYQKHLDNLLYISNNVKYDEIIYLGDFNLSNLHWIYHSNNLLPTNLKSDIDILVVSSLLSNNLRQCNPVLNDNGKILDLVFTTMV